MAVGVIRLSKANGGCTGYPQLVLWCGENHVHLVSATEELGDPTVHTNGMAWRQRTLTRLPRSPDILCYTLHKRHAVRDDGSMWPAVITLLNRTSDVEIIEMVYRLGTDNSEEIAIVRRSLESVRAEYERANTAITAVKRTTRRAKDRPPSLDEDLRRQAHLAGSGRVVMPGAGRQADVHEWWSPR
jgi:hypothetical protein